MAKQKELKAWEVHYGDSGEPNTGLFETNAFDKVGSLNNFAKHFSVKIPEECKNDIDAVEGILTKNSFIMGEVEEAGPATFTISVCRTGYGFRDIDVEANSEEEASEKALELAGDHEYSEKESEYSVDGFKTDDQLHNLQDEVRSVFGVNLVRCCNCDYPLAHSTDEKDDEELEIECPKCKEKVSVNDCCDMDY